VPRGIVATDFANLMADRTENWRTQVLPSLLEMHEVSDGGRFWVKLRNTRSEQNESAVSVLATAAPHESA
jgi:hypothetical protein